MIRNCPTPATPSCVLKHTICNAHIEAVETERCSPIPQVRRLAVRVLLRQERRQLVTMHEISSTTITHNTHNIFFRVLSIKFNEIQHSSRNGMSINLNPS